jgi:hypothetical protein
VKSVVASGPPSLLAAAAFEHYTSSFVRGFVDHCYEIVTISISVGRDRTGANGAVSLRPH